MVLCKLILPQNPLLPVFISPLHSRRASFFKLFVFSDYSEKVVVFVQLSKIFICPLRVGIIVFIVLSNLLQVMSIIGIQRLPILEVRLVLKGIE